MSPFGWDFPAMLVKYRILICGSRYYEGYCYVSEIQDTDLWFWIFCLLLLHTVQSYS